MKVLHTADLHIGQTLGGRDRHDEQETVLDEIVDIADVEQVDLVLVCGDLFHHKTPGPRSWEVAGRFLRRASQGGKRGVFVLAGNHDSADLLHSLSTFFALSNVMMITRPVSISIKDKFNLAAIPWIFERETSTATIMGDQESGRYACYSDYVTAQAHEMVNCRPPAMLGLPTILAMHAALDGARVGVGERALHVTETYAVKIGDLPDVDYIAMGHFHRPQVFDEDGRCAVYPGSPFALDFGEREDEKRVVVVEFGEDAPVVKSVPLTTPRKLIDVEVDWDDPHAVQKLVEIVGGPGGWWRLTINVPEPMPEVAAEARRLWPHAVQIKVIAPDVEAQADELPELDRTPRAALSAWWSETHDGEGLPTSVGYLFDALLEEVTA